MKQSLILILIVTLISACILVFAFRMAHSFTFEGELDPNEFIEWPVIGRSLISPEIGTVVVQNPDSSSPIQKIQLLIYVSTDTLIAYQYFKNGEIYQYVLDIEKDRYVRKLYTDEEKKGCMKCHENEIRPSSLKGV